MNEKYHGLEEHVVESINNGYDNGDKDEIVSMSPHELAWDLIDKTDAIEHYAILADELTDLYKLHALIVEIIRRRFPEIGGAGITKN